MSSVSTTTNNNNNNNNNHGNSILNVSDEEYEKQFRYIQALKRMEYFTNTELDEPSRDVHNINKEKTKLSSAQMSSAKISSARISFRHPSQASFDEELILSPDECRIFFLLIFSILLRVIFEFKTI